MNKHYTHHSTYIAHQSCCLERSVHCGQRLMTSRTTKVWNNYTHARAVCTTLLHLLRAWERGYNTPDYLANFVNTQSRSWCMYWDDRWLSNARGQISYGHAQSGWSSGSPHIKPCLTQVYKLACSSWLGLDFMSTGISRNNSVLS